MATYTFRDASNPAVILSHEVPTVDRIRRPGSINAGDSLTVDTRTIRRIFPIELSAIRASYALHGDSCR